MIWIRRTNTDDYGNIIDQPDEPVQEIRKQRKTRVKGSVRGQESFYFIRIFLPPNISVTTADQIVFVENGEGIAISNVYPVEDSAGQIDHIEVDT